MVAFIARRFRQGMPLDYVANGWFGLSVMKAIVK